MANVLDKNPIVFDTAGATSAVARRLRVQTIAIYPDADTWVVVMHDAASGDVIVDASGTVAASGPHVIEFGGNNGLVISGLYLTTLTDVAKVVVYIDAGTPI